MPHEVEGSLQGQGLRIGVVASRFNHDVTERLLQGALDTLRNHGVADADVTVVWVPAPSKFPSSRENWQSPDATKPSCAWGPW